MGVNSFTKWVLQVKLSLGSKHFYPFFHLASHMLLIFLVMGEPGTLFTLSTTSSPKL